MIRAVVCTLVLSSATTAFAEPASFALIVTNNRSQSESRPDLHYADDDGVQYAALFGELIGRDRVTLLTTLDAATAALHGHVDARAPTRRNLFEAVEQLAAQLRAVREAGASAAVYLVFAGHGDIDRGKGYLDLADGRLTSSALDEQVIRPLAADRIHLILDSCNSYFLLNPRKPGGKRWASESSRSPDLLTKHPHLGAILSTSAEAVTYEWSELQSGVFSYEVRAGLRGAADVDADGRITYAELAAFIRVANQPLVNDLYRPKIFSRNPRADGNATDAVLAQLPAGGRRLHLGSDENQRLTLRDPQGVRVMDVHKESGTALTLALPPHVALEAQQYIVGPQRLEYAYRDIPAGDGHFAALPPRAAERIGRGESPLFNQLFTEPFGRRAFERVQAESKTEEAPPSGVTRADYARLRLHLSSAAVSGTYFRRTLGLSWLAFAAIPIGALTYSVYRVSDRRGDWADHTGFWTGVGTAASLLSWSIYLLTVSSNEEDLYEAFSDRDAATERARSRVTLDYEIELKTHAAASRGARLFGGWSNAIGGALTAAIGGVILGEDAARHDPVRLQGPLNILVGLGQFAFGVYFLLWAETPLENTWGTYSRDPAVVQRGVEW